MIIGAVIVTLAVLPGYFIHSLWRSRRLERAPWLLRVLYTGALILYVFLIGPWDWVSYYLRYVSLFAYIWVVAASIRDRTRSGPMRESRVVARSELATLLIFLYLLGWAASGYRYTEEPVRLAFPLKDGWFYVGQGGRSRILNYHTSYSPQRYALDIVALNSYGARARGLYPRTLTQYQIFGMTVYSPCDGKVARVADGLPDLTPPESDRDHPAGNHVVVTCNGVHIALAHFMSGSIVVAEGSEIKSGEPLGQVGNSGNTSEPHLHIHAVKVGGNDLLEGEGVPILFDGAFLVRNSTLRR